MSDGEFVKEVAALALAGRPEAVTGRRGVTVMAPNDWTPHSLEAFQDRPNRITTHRKFADVGSLVSYLNRYATDDLLNVVSDPKTGVISAILDYHDPSGTDGADDPAEPRWCQHRADFVARFTPEYEAWRKLHRKPINQTDAGEFLEDRLHDIIEPTGGDVMDMVMKFDALKKVVFSQSTRLRDGNVQVLYSEENEARGTLTLPDTVTLMLPVYEGMEPERITVRLRFRITEGKLSFTFVIANIESIERQAFRRCEDTFSTAMSGVNLLQT